MPVRGIIVHKSIIAAVKSTSAAAVAVFVFVLVAMTVATPRISRAAEHRAGSAPDAARVDAALRPGDTLVLDDAAWADQLLRNQGLRS